MSWSITLTGLWRFSFVERDSSAVCDKAWCCQHNNQTAPRIPHIVLLRGIVATTHKATSQNPLKTTRNGFKRGFLKGKGLY